MPLIPKERHSTDSKILLCVSVNCSVCYHNTIMVYMSFVYKITKMMIIVLS